jgi:hypothetical protein
MTWKTRLALLATTASVVSLGVGCITPPGPLDSDKKSSDAGGTGGNDARVDPADAKPGDKAESGPTYRYCTPDKPFHAVPWAPPTAMHQTLCTATQEQGYMADYHGNKIASFAGDPDNASCFTCIETNATDTHHGPVIVASDGSIESNYGGCVANLDGDTSSTGCGAILAGYNNCAIQECGDCKDYTDPPYTHAEACLKAAVAEGGPCHDYSTTPTCQAEIAKGGVAAVCGELDDFLPLWCTSKTQ